MTRCCLRAKRERRIEYSRQGGTRLLMYDRIVYGRRAGWRARIAACLLSLGAAVAALGATSAPAFPLAHDAGAFLTTTGQGSAPIPPGFKLRSSNGYTIEFYALQASSANGSVALAFIVVSGRTGSVSYLAPATATASSVEADLGELGRISVIFHATGGTRRQRPICGKNQAFSGSPDVSVGHVTVTRPGRDGHNPPRLSIASAISA